MVVGGDDTPIRQKVLDTIREECLKRGMAVNVILLSDISQGKLAPFPWEKQGVIWDKSPILAIGGDGTFIGAMKYGEQRPVIGVNMGTLGFLTEIPPTKKGIASAIAKLHKWNYYTLFCKNLDYNIWRKGAKVFEGWAVNDVVLARDNAVSNIVFDATNNGRFIHRYSADGMVISSPIGASAYALSCGAPIIEPTSNIICMSPIAPHSLNNRSLVFDNHSATLELIVRRSRNSAVKTIVCVDGRNEYELEEGDTVRVWMGKRESPIIRFDAKAAYERLALRLA